MYYISRIPSCDRKLESDNPPPILGRYSKRFLCYGDVGPFPEGVSVVPLGSHVKTLPCGTALVLGTLTCSPLCRTNSLGFAF